MQDTAHHAAERAGRHAAVYRLVTAGAAADRLLPPGTEGAIGRAQTCYDENPEAAGLLREMNLAVFRLRQSLHAGAEMECRTQRQVLAGLAGAWLYLAPLSHVAELFPSEGIA